MFCKSARGIAILTERRAAGAARPASHACQTNRFRYWLLQIAAEQRPASVLPSVTVDIVECALEPRIGDDIRPVTDGNNVYPPRVKSLGIKHEAWNKSTGARARGAIHMQTVNNRHRGLKDFLRSYRGVSRKCLGNYLRLYEQSDLLKSAP